MKDAFAVGADLMTHDLPVASVRGRFDHDDRIRASKRGHRHPALERDCPPVRSRIRKLMVGLTLSLTVLLACVLAALAGREPMRSVREGPFGAVRLQCPAASLVVDASTVSVQSRRRRAQRDVPARRAPPPPGAWSAFH